MSEKSLNGTTITSNFMKQWPSLLTPMLFSFRASKIALYPLWWVFWAGSRVVDFVSLHGVIVMCIFAAFIRNFTPIPFKNHIFAPSLYKHTNKVHSCLVPFPPRDPKRLKKSDGAEIVISITTYFLLRKMCKHLFKTRSTQYLCFCPTVYCQRVCIVQHNISTLSTRVFTVEKFVLNISAEFTSMCYFV